MDPINCPECRGSKYITVDTPNPLSPSHTIRGAILCPLCEGRGFLLISKNGQGIQSP